MEALLELILKTYGLAGILLLSPLAAVWFLWKENKELRGLYQAAMEKVNETHLKRVDDSKAVSEKLLAMVQEHAELSTETNLALDRVGDTLTIVQANMGRGFTQQPARRSNRVEDEG